MKPETRKPWKGLAKLAESGSAEQLGQFLEALPAREVALAIVSVGLINGLALGLLIAGVAVLWKGNPYLGLVVGLALCLNTLVAVSIGGTIPLLLKRFQMDPAIASGPIVTTVTDMCGFFLVLGIATVLLPYLTS